MKKILFIFVLCFQSCINAVNSNQTLRRLEINTQAFSAPVSDDSIINRVLTTLWSSDAYTAEQKGTIRKEIADLQAQNIRIETRIKGAHDSDTVAALKDLIKSNEEEMYQKKVAIGDAWSPGRKAFILAMVAALGFGVFKYMHPAVGGSTDINLPNSGTLNTTSSARLLKPGEPLLDSPSNPSLVSSNQRDVVNTPENALSSTKESTEGWNEWFWRNVIGAPLASKE